VSRVVNADPVVGDVLKVVFVPNYNVTVAELIIPGSDINQQISTAGTEASGTSNMKFAFNASLIVGTWDGANIEIAESIGEENIFLFGAKADEVDGIRASAGSRELDPRLKRVFQSIRSGLFGDPSEYDCLIWPVEHGDPYLVGYDFPYYLEAQAAVDAAYKDQAQWVRKCIASTAGMEQFSSDRTITEYAEHIWGIKPHPVPHTTEQGLPDPQQLKGPGSIGSLRRQALAARPARDTGATPLPVKGTYGSLTRRSQGPPASARPPALGGRQTAQPEPAEDEVDINL
jgi:starch phosphorylase